MKTPIAIVLVALALATATGASAYHFSPVRAAVHLHGKLTFTPNEGNGQPFTCSVTLDLKTKPLKTGPSIIKAVKFPHGDCQGVEFDGFPWGVQILNANSGAFGGGSYASADGICVTDETHFQDNGSGIWTLPVGGCLSGTLTSNPPTTIVK